jgi:hypothetical protein
MAQSRVEFEEKIDDEIAFPYRAGNAMFPCSDPCYRKHVEKDVTLCLPRL